MSSEVLQATPTCLLLADGSRSSAVQAARQLGSRGVRVLIACANSGSKMMQSSRYCFGAEDFSTEDPRAFCLSVASWAQEVAPGTKALPVIPLSDRLVDFITRNRDAFSEVFVLGVPRDRVVRTLISKESSFEIAESAGLNVAPWRKVDKAAQLIPAADHTGFPLIVRPTTWATAGSEYFKYFVAENLESYTTLASAALDRGAVLMVQRFMPAPDGSKKFAMTFQSAQGGGLHVCTGTKQRESQPTGGVMTWGIAHEDENVREQAKRFVTQAGFTGLGGVEFILADETLWFVEFNPRPEAIHFIADVAGLPMLWWLHQDLCGRKPRIGAPELPAAGWVGSAWIERLNVDPEGLPLFLRDRLAFMRFSRRMDAVWSWNDPGPGFHYLGTLLNALLRKVLTRVQDS